MTRSNFIRPIKAIFIVLAMSFLTPSSASAQEFDGKDFWLGFLSTLPDPTLKLQLNIISDTAATVTVSVPLSAGNYTQTFQLSPNVLYTHTIPTNIVNNNAKSHVKRNTGVHVESDANIIVYIGNNQDYSSDAATAIPTSALGTQYDVIAYSALSLTRSSTFNIIGTEDNTEIDITYNGCDWPTMEALKFSIKEVQKELP